VWNKNCKNFLKSCHHEEDFHIAAKRNFLATLYRKNPCDGICGTVQQLVARATLQATERIHILTPEDLYKWAKKITGITLFYITQKKESRHMF
jgi:hypothetical protein